MTVKTFMRSKTSDIIDIILNLNNTFNSHDFLMKFAKRFELEYITFLFEYNSVGAFQTIHSQIAKFLSENSMNLNIEKTEQTESRNVFGEIVRVQGWRKIK